MFRRLSLCFLMLFLISIEPCLAEIVTVEAENVGWYRKDGYHFQTNGISVGVYQPTTLSDEYYAFASYLVFSIPQITEEVVDVTFSLELTYYGSDDLSETILLSGVSTSIDTLIASHTGAGRKPSIYRDLKDGPELGSMEVNLGNLFPYIALFEPHGPVFSSNLNATGVQMVEGASGGQFAIGLSMLNTDGDREEHIGSKAMWGDPNYWVAQLDIVTVPEPGIFLYMALGLIGFRRKTPFNR